MRWWWCTVLLSVMIGDRFHRREKMTSQGGEGCCGTEEIPSPDSSVPGKLPTENCRLGLEAKEGTGSPWIDFCSQARKTLSERSPFDVSEESTSGSVSVTTLPSVLASSLNRHSESRRRHRKSHSGADKKSTRAGDRSRGNSIWVETEEYFRDLSLPDIDYIFPLSSLSDLATKKCFSIPQLEPRPSSSNAGVVVSDSEIPRNANVGHVKNEDSSMVIDNTGSDVSPSDDKECSTSDCCNGLGWLLGCRNKISLASERPSKKRKLLGCDAGLDKVLIARPCEGGASLCHYCSIGDSGNKTSGLIVCSSCKVAVHRKCYGVQDGVDGPWLCARCKQNSFVGPVGDSANTCVLCPKKGGALKPAYRNVEDGGSVEYAHLFCCLWMPEVYIEDLTRMEPVMNISGIKEARRKLVCNVCKVKCGACVRCSHGACRSSFHPICAREAKHKMEVWAKHGNDDVELRAFCSKHSETPDNVVLRSGNSLPSVGPDVSAVNNCLVTFPLPHKSKLDHDNGDMGASTEAYDKVGESDSELQEITLSAFKSDATVMIQGDGRQHTNDAGRLVGKSDEDVYPSDSVHFTIVLKKLIDLGKVDVKDVALDIGISPELLIANLSDDCVFPEVRLKIVTWLRNHAYMNTFQKNLRSRVKPVNSCKDEIGDCVSDSLAVSGSAIMDPVSVKSVPPKRRTTNNIILFKDNNLKSSGDAISTDMLHVEDCEADQPVISSPDTVSTRPENCQAPLANNSSDKPCNSSMSERVAGEEGTISMQNSVGGAYSCRLDATAAKTADSAFITTELVTSYIHPYVGGKLMQIQNGVPLEGIRHSWKDDPTPVDIVCCDNHDHHSDNHGAVTSIDQSNAEQLILARKMRLLKSCPEDEVEGEIIYFQHRVLSNLAARKQFTYNLICNVVKSLPLEIDATRQQQWDAVLVNRYLSDLKEVKKQGRKERRHKEAQAVLAAATAAAAASSRVSSFRKDALDESVSQENMFKLDAANGRPGISSQSLPRARETLSRVAVTCNSTEKHSGLGITELDHSREHPRSCEICRRSETINPILICSSCKVAVHLDCYRSVKESMGPWYCELCESVAYRTSGIPAVNFWEKTPFIVECGLCGGSTGAFRKTSDGQWVHAFCAEWVFETTFIRGQVHPVEGMETLLRGTGACCICRRKYGVCIKCNYGHCLTIFHPSCARSAGLYMSVRTVNGKLQHKAYCEKHSLEQRAKAETQRHGTEELKNIKQIRVELERLRLLCERIVKREKIKRELVLCSHDILAFKRDHVAHNMLVHNPFFLTDGSSESATTSLKGYTDDYKSCSDAMQRSDDITVDSSVSAKKRTRAAVAMDGNQRTDDDCPTSQSSYNRNVIVDRVRFSGKQIPQRGFRNNTDGGWKSKKSRKHSEMLEKELVMTSDEASMKNSMLPKGYAYVPADCLSNDKQQLNEGRPIENDG